MDRWTDGWMDKWMDEWEEARRNGKIGKWPCLRHAMLQVESITAWSFSYSLLWDVLLGAVLEMWNE